MVGYGVDIRAPRPPFVLFKVGWRYSALGSVVEPLYRVVGALVRLVAGLVGYFVGVGKEVEMGRGGETEFGGEMGMGGDEFL